MKIIIEGDAKEIAALVLGVQEQQMVDVDRIIIDPKKFRKDVESTES
ncbi:MAG: hypothetical protein IJV26_07665 [Lachnospiraceae bacterium]|nr:hypothetical protein [Lachnospiraceae bacterium]